MSVTFAPDGNFIVHSFSGDDWRDCRDHVKSALGLTDTATIVRNERPQPRDSNAAANVQPALAIWRQARPISGTPAEAYLERRGVPFADPAGEILRWHPACPFGGTSAGAMVALIRNIHTNAPQGVHRTAIAADGNKRAELGSNGRLTLGVAKDGAIKLTDDADVSTSIAIGEGIESTLAIRAVSDLSTMPIWAVLTAGGIGRFPVLAGIQALWVGVDNDASGTGLRCAQLAGLRHLEEGVEVIFVTCSKQGDLADVVAKT